MDPLHIKQSKEHPGHPPQKKTTLQVSPCFFRPLKREPGASLRPPPRLGAAVSEPERGSGRGG